MALSSFTHTLHSHSSAPLALKCALAVTALTTACLLYYNYSYSNSLTRGRKMSGSGNGDEAPITHIVMFQYLPTISATTKADVAAAFLALKDACVRPADTAAGRAGETYILSVDGGPNTSPEGLSRGLEHAYTLSFRTAADLNYYLARDPAHQAFKAGIADKVAQVVVFDYTSGAFARDVQQRNGGNGKKRRKSDESHVRTV